MLGQRAGEACWSRGLGTERSAGQTPLQTEELVGSPGWEEISGDGCIRLFIFQMRKPTLSSLLKVQVLIIVMEGSHHLSGPFSPH